MGDFTDDCINVTVPAAATAGAQTFDVPEFFSIVDDNIDEVEQSFALVATIGPDVTPTCYVEDPVTMIGMITECACFQTEVGVMECHGQSGVTEIRITDNDCK